MEILQDLKDQILTYYDVIIAFIPKLIIGLLIVGVLFLILRTLRKKLYRILSLRADDKLLVGFVDNVFRMFNITIGIMLFLYVIGQAGLASSILGAATISSVVIGFAFKDIAENFLAGIIMAFNRPFRIGDTILTGNVEGVIVAMNLRYTHVKTFDGKDVYVPNGQIIKQPLYNYTIDGFLRASFTVGVDYDSDIDKARSIILHEVNQVPGVLKEEKPAITHVKNLNTNTVDIEVRYWIDTFDKNYSGVEIKSQAQTKAINALTEAEIGMPANIIELKNYNDSPLKQEGDNTTQA